jgi:hypothetical protein
LARAVVAFPSRGEDQRGIPRLSSVRSSAICSAEAARRTDNRDSTVRGVAVAAVDIVSVGALGGKLLAILCSQ